MRTRLIDAFPDWTGLQNKYAIFKTLDDLDTDDAYPFLDQYARLDAEYIANMSGSKSVSPIVERLIAENETKELTDAQRTVLAKIILNRFGTKWAKLYAILSMEYNPIENYSMTETETPNLSHKHLVSDDYALTEKSLIGTDLLTETERNTSANVYGFNSSTAVPSNDGTDDGSTRVFGNSEDNTTETTRMQTGYTEDTETGTRTLTRSGNIGVTTSQQMAQSEINLWQWNFVESLYKDVDTVLTIPIYTI